MNARGEQDPKRQTEAAVAKTGPRTLPHVTLNEINHLAYRKWDAAGRPAGDCACFWLEAERDLIEGP